MTAAPLLLLETSTQPGLVGLADGPRLVASRALESGRHHARDLAPAVAELLGGQGWAANNLAAVAVGRGPGSYTGLRVGLMSAKTLAFVTGCRLLAVDTFAVVAEQTPPDCDAVDVLADAQKDCVYAQPFRREAGAWRPAAGLAILPLADWLAGRDRTAAVSGPGLTRYRDRLPAEAAVAPEECRSPGLDALLRLAWRRFEAGEGDDPLALEPLYLRPSSAEQQWRGRRGESEGRP